MREINRLVLTDSDTKPAPKRARKQATAPAAPSKRAIAQAHRHAWAHTGVIMCVGMSAGLNGYANSMHATIAWAGWALGVMIPCLVLVLSKVAGMQYRAGSRKLAYFTGCVGASLLLLSVWHCACSIALLTGVSHAWMCVPMAVAIDGGLVACELDIVLA